MKVFTFVLVAFAIAWPQCSLFANDHLVKIHYDGSHLMAVHLVKGDIDLFVSNHSEEKRVTGPRYRKQKKVFVKRYFLKFQGEVTKITPYNYKRILRKYLPNAPELHQRLGKPGFRYENTPSIIRYYNTFKTPGIKWEDSLDVPEIELGRKKD